MSTAAENAVSSPLAAGPGASEKRVRAAEAGMRRYSVEALPVHLDARGAVFEPLGPDALPGQGNAHVAVSGPGTVRGNHRHLRGTETLTVQGPALVRLRQDDGVHDVEVPAGAFHRFLIPPGVSHAVRNTGDAPTLLVAFNTVPYDPRDPDVEADALLE